MENLGNFGSYDYWMTVDTIYLTKIIFCVKNWIIIKGGIIGLEFNINKMKYIKYY